MADDLDFSGEVVCRNCKRAFSEVERVCPYCGADYRTNWDRADYRAIGGCITALCGIGICLDWLLQSDWIWTTSSRDLRLILAGIGAVALGYWVVGYLKRDHWADD